VSVAEPDPALRVVSRQSHHSEGQAMMKVLVIDDEPLVRDSIAEAFRIELHAEVQVAVTGQIAAKMITFSRFHLSVIDATLPDICGLQLATIAANANIPVVLISGDPDTNGCLHRFDYPFLVKPFNMSTLLLVSAHIMLESQKNIRRVKASASKMLAAADALERR
jgi:DNA-binding NtrC family response regulator